MNDVAINAALVVGASGGIGSAVVDLIKKSLDDSHNSSEKALIECLDFATEISKVLKHN